MINYEDSNEPRAQWGLIAALAFVAECSTDPEDAVADLIGNLCHLADKMGLDGMAQGERALRMYASEKAECPRVKRAVRATKSALQSARPNHRQQGA